MKLKSLLLGSSAAVFVGGASISGAQAADPNPAGLVAATMASYVESCDNGNGWKKGNWCLTLAGDVTFTARFGYDIAFTYGAVPDNAAPDNVDVPTTVSRGAFNTGSGLFNTSTNLALTIKRDDITLRFPILGSSLSLVAGNWTLTSNSVTWQETFGNGFKFGIQLAETNTLGWVDRLADDGAFAGPPAENVVTTEWQGVAAVPDVQVTAGFRMFTMEGHYGRRTAIEANSTYVSGIGAQTPFNTFGFSGRAEVPLGPLTLTARASWDRIQVLEDYNVIAGDDNDTVTFAEGNAWAIQGMAKGGFGPINLMVEAALANNWGGYTQLGSSSRIYPYTANVEGRYVFIAATVGVEFGAAGEFTLAATYANGPQLAGNDDDRVLTVDAGVKVGLAAIDGLTVQAGVGLDRQLNDDPVINVLDITGGFTFVPGGTLPGVTITGLVGHERDLTGVLEPATRGEMTIKVAF